MGTPGDTIRTLDWEELPASVRDIPKGQNPMADGLLMKHQQEWGRMINTHDLCLAEKGRRTGITYATALNDTITAASSRKAGGDNIYYVGDTKEKGLEFIGYCAHFAKVMAIAMASGWNGIEVFLFEDQQPDGSTKHITSYRIRLASGFQIVALSSNPANIRGLQGIVNIDEAAFHANVAAVIDAATALIIWGGKIRIISTHNGAKNPFNQLIRDTRAGLYDFTIMRVTFDDAVKNGLFERVCMVKGWTPTPEGKAAWYKRVRGAYGANKAAMLEELDAIPREGSGVAIPGILIEACMKEDRPILRLALDNEFPLKGEAYRNSWTEAWIRQHLKPLLDALDKDRDHYFGSDYSRYCDFAVTAPMSLEQNLTRRVPFLIEMHNVPTRQQEQIIWCMIDHLPRFRSGAMDATGNGQTIAEYTADKYGHERIHQVTLNDAWYRDNMGPFVDAFEDQTIDLGKDADVLNDLRSLERIDGIVKLPKLRVDDTKDNSLKRHGDSAIALVLGHFATRQGGGPIAYGGSDPDDAVRLTGRLMRGADRGEEEPVSLIRTRRFDGMRQLARRLVGNG
jgi:phage FluMu gp28-like protein